MTNYYAIVKMMNDNLKVHYTNNIKICLLEISNFKYKHITSVI